MKKIIPIIIAIFAVACGGQQITRVEKGAVFDISPEILSAEADTTIQLGKMRQGEIVQYDAWLRNTGSNPFVIIDVDASCGCTAVKYDRRPIPPGEKGKFSFRFDSRGQIGVQLRLIEVRTSAAPQRYRFFIGAQVE